jgi:hypothetical protein
MNRVKDRVKFIMSPFLRVRHAIAMHQQLAATA